MFLWSEHVYGPVRSRRLGRSLGVNLLPAGRKVCSYDCPYCECGFTRGGPVDERRVTRLPTGDEVLAALERALEQAGGELDAITFAGNGEPTLHPEFERVLAATAGLRDRLAPAARITLLTNGIRLLEPGPRAAALGHADEVEVKLDAGTEATFRRVAVPTVPWTLADLRGLLVGLGSQASVQTCLFRGSVDNTGEADLGGMVNLLAEAGPRRVLAYTIERSPAEATLEPAPPEVIEDYVARLRGVGVPAEPY